MIRIVQWSHCITELMRKMIQVSLVPFILIHNKMPVIIRDSFLVMHTKLHTRRSFINQCAHWINIADIQIPGFRFRLVLKVDIRLNYPPSWWELSWGPHQRPVCCLSAGRRCLSWTGPGWQTGGSGARRPAQRAGWAHTPGSTAPQTAADGGWGAWCVPAHTGRYRRGPAGLQGCDLEIMTSKHLLWNGSVHDETFRISSWGFFSLVSCIESQITPCFLTIFAPTRVTNASPCYVTEKLQHTDFQGIRRSKKTAVQDWDKVSVQTARQVATLKACRWTWGFNPMS